MANSIQLGKTSAIFTVASAQTVVGGDYADSIGRAAADVSVTVTGGAGADAFYVRADNTSDTGNDMTVTDFVVGTDKVVLTGDSTGAINLLTNVGASGVFDIAGSANNIFQFTLTGVANTVTAANIVQLGDSSNAFNAIGAATAITAGNFADYITVTVTNDHTITGGLGADTVVLAGGNETLAFSEGDSTVTGYDQVRGGWGATSATVYDRLDLAGSATVATGLGSTASGSIASATLSNGIVTFKNAAGANIASSSLVLADALAFLGANLVGARDTVAFIYKVDRDGDGAFTGNNNPTSTQVNEVSTFVYQNGTVDTVIEIMGVESLTAVSTTAAANTLFIA
jgi:hypothetical protein